MKKIFALIVVFGVLGGGWGVWSFYKPDAATNTPGAAVSSEIKLGSIQSIVTAQGTLEPKDYVDVGAQVSGEVIKLHVEIGDAVKKGDLIAEIDPDVYEAQVKSSEAQLKMLAAQKAQQEALIKQAQWKYERNQRLYKDKAVSKETLEDAEIDLDVAKASLLSLEAQIEQAQSSLDENQTNLNYTKIYAPMDGTVVDQSVEEGETINANQTTPTIVQVANMDVMTAKAEVAEADVMKLESGMNVYFTTLGSGDRRWEGDVRQILPTPEEINDVILYNVLVDVSNKDHTLLPGMTTQMFFVLAQAKDVPLIPANTLGRRLKDHNTDQGEAYEVQAMGRTGPETRTVIISLSDRTQAAVVKGVEVGEHVISTMKTQVPHSEGRGGPPMRL
mgnify:CR=1 FL=1